MDGVDAVIHAATLHKPHVGSHARHEFIDINITGTLNLLEAAAFVRAGSFVFASTTSVFGDALTPPAGAPAAWVTEDSAPIPENIYGVTKTAAENLCELFHGNNQLPAVKANEFLYRRVDLEQYRPRVRERLGKERTALAPAI